MSYCDPIHAILSLLWLPAHVRAFFGVPASSRLPMRPIALAKTPAPRPSRTLQELRGLLLLLLAVLLALALVSYRPADPSLDTAGALAVHNWTGRAGAAVADLLLQLEGASAYAGPLLLTVMGVATLRRRGTSTKAAKAIGIVLLALTFPALLALLPGRLELFGAIPIAGVAGALLLDTLAAWLNLPGAAVLLLFLTAAAVYLLTDLTLAQTRQALLVRLAFLARLRDRWRRWRMARAARAQARAAERQAEREVRAAERDQVKQTRRSRKSAPLMPDEQPDPLSEQAVPPVLPRAAMAALEHGTPAPVVASGWDEDEFAESIAAPVPAGPAVSETYARQTRVAVYEEQPAVEPQAAAITARADAVPAARPVTLTARAVAGHESNYKLPPTTLLHSSEEVLAVREEALRAEAEVLIQKCAEFDVHGQVTQINPGPVVTTFEFRPDAGVKYSRITGLSDDLALGMAAESILIERMAGKSTVGIQIPNAERETIWLRDVVEAEGFVESRSKITMAMGKDINGRTVIADLATMPHVLIAGSTGSGKSVAINAMIMSVLYKATPEQVRLILVDPKRVELGMYEGVPHLFTPIITEPKLAANALKNAVREMERRLKLLASRSVRNLDQYNRLFDEHPTLWDEQGVEEKPLPYIMIIIDELADLMILDRSNVEEAITRLAQMARAVGIHLVLATQRPSVDVITGLIKANVPTRMSFRLSTKVDSRTILDANGAESLLGRGDMLFLPPGTSRLQRVHAPFVTEKEIAGVVSFWKAQGEAQYVEAFLDAPRDASGASELDGEGSADDNDPLFDDAVRLVFEFGKASTSLLQRRMRIGYGRAAALIDMMERDGLVGPPDGSKPRELLKAAGWLQESEEGMR